MDLSTPNNFASDTSRVVAIVAFDGAPALDIASKRPEVRAAFTEAFTSISKRLSGRSETNARCIESRSLSAAALIVGALAVANTTDNQALKQKLIASCKENASTLLNDTERSTPTFFWEPAL